MYTKRSPEPAATLLPSGAQVTRNKFCNTHTFTGQSESDSTTHTFTGQSESDSTTHTFTGQSESDSTTHTFTGQSESFPPPLHQPSPGISLTHFYKCRILHVYWLNYIARRKKYFYSHCICNRYITYIIILYKSGYLFKGVLVSLQDLHTSLLRCKWSDVKNTN